LIPSKILAGCIKPGGSIVDGATIFVYVLSATFFGLIFYLARLSRRSHTADNVTPKESKPRKAA
jgi:hypothetical protein